MRESPLGFEYTWEDLRPVRPLFVTTLVCQGLGAIAGFAIGYFPAWFENVWIGAAVATFPGFVLGIPVQRRARAEAIAENLVMVRRIGLVALVLSVAGLTMPWWWRAN